MSPMKISGLVIIILLIIGFMEIVGGLVSGSLALFSDVGHVSMDVLAQGVVLFGQWNPFRWKRPEPIAALFNGVLLLVVGFSFGFLGWQRLGEPQEVQPILMTIFALFGLLGNGIVVWLRRKGSKESISIRSGLLHAVSDTVASLGLLVGGVIIIFTQWFWIDAVLTMSIAALILLGAVKIGLDSWHILRCTGSCRRSYCLAYLERRL